MPTPKSENTVTINDMLTALSQFKKEYGNLPVAFWEGCVVEMQFTPSRNGITVRQGSGKEPTEVVIEVLFD